MPSLFTRILQGQIPGEFVLREPVWSAILDINPTAPGHCLLIPAAEAQHLHELPAATLAALGPSLARLTAAVRRATGCPAVSVVVNDGAAAGQEVPHAHIHIIPRFPDDGRRAGLFGGKRAEPAALAEMGARLRAAVAEG